MARVPFGVSSAPVQTLGAPFQVDIACSAAALGYSSYWIAEANATEASRSSARSRPLRRRSRSAPACSRCSSARRHSRRWRSRRCSRLAPDRDVFLGIGISSPVVVGQWHGAEYGNRPLAQMREYVALVRECLSGETVTFAGDFYSVKRFRLGVRLGERRPKIVIGALNPKMLQTAGEIADGVLLNYLPASHVPWSVEQVRKGGDATDLRLHPLRGHRPRPVPGSGPQGPLRRTRWSTHTPRTSARAGFGAEVDALRAAGAAGDREATVAAISDAMVDAIQIMGVRDHVADAVADYVAQGVQVPIVFPLPVGRGPPRDGPVHDGSGDPTTHRALSPRLPDVATGAAQERRRSEMSAQGARRQRSGANDHAPLNSALPGPCSRKLATPVFASSVSKLRRSTRLRDRALRPSGGRDHRRSPASRSPSRRPHRARAAPAQRKRVARASRRPRPPVDDADARALRRRAPDGRLHTISLARAGPTSRASRCVPPPPGMMPSRISGWPSRGCRPRCAGRTRARARARHRARSRGCAAITGRWMASHRVVRGTEACGDAARAVGRELELLDVGTRGERLVAAGDHHRLHRRVGGERRQPRRGLRRAARSTTDSSAGGSA